VVNAFRLKALKDMSQLAQAVGKTEDAAMFVRQEKAEELVFQDRLFDREAGLFRDGVGTDHTSFHANLFPLAFGLVPPANRTKVAAWLAGRGMAGSVYAAQYLLQGLFENGQDRAAIALMIAPGDRSWRHMVESGATITWEAWDQKYKPNQDWNHAWGAAPANLLPNLVLGMQPLTPGWGRALIQPHPGGLSHAEGKMPTPRGELNVAWDQTHSFTLTIALPSSMTAMVKLPEKKDSTGIWINGAPAKAHRKDGWWLVDKDVSGTVRVEER
jgi:alpha-L-rhamnosidase